MTNINILETKRTPAIDFNFDQHALRMSGESYPEDAGNFYGEILQALETYLSECQGQSITVDFELIYFNSSTAKSLMRCFDLLEDAAEDNTITVQWHHDSDDDNMAELGEEFGEDLEKAVFKLIEK